MDLYATGTVVECKNVMSGLETLRQLDDYLTRCRAASPGRPWRGHIVVSTGYTTELRRSIASRDDIRLWQCVRETNGRPRLVEVLPVARQRRSRR
jgi:hypothetical protein